MGLDIQKRLGDIQTQLDGQAIDKRGLKTTVLQCCITLIIAGLVLSVLFSASSFEVNTNIRVPLQKTDVPKSDGKISSLLARLEGRTQVHRERRAAKLKSISVGNPHYKAHAVDNLQLYNWMDQSIIYSPVSGLFHSIASELLDISISKQEVVESNSVGVVELDDVFTQAKSGALRAITRLIFLTLVVTPIWLIGYLLGPFLLNLFLHKEISGSVLGVCDPGNGPFYSGVWGPFKPNNSFSGTDFSCPGLACPQMVPEQTAASHPLYKMLSKNGALNDVSSDLIRVILNYKHYPSFVEEEKVFDTSHGENDDIVLAESNDGLLTNEEGTIEQSALHALPAVLEAYHAVVEISKATEKLLEPGTDAFDVYSEIAHGKCQNLSPLAAILVRTLTPARAAALVKVPAALVASAYLCTEAGKFLVYKPVDKKTFSLFSRYPHLQARAVINSLPSFHRCYNGDARLILRQAVICSRRNGDFGRAFLPISMPAESRAMRDWLEILYSEPSKREEFSYLAELNIQLEEIHNNWKKNFHGKFRATYGLDNLQKGQLIDQSEKGKYPIWKGISHKSVVMLPLNNLVEIGFAGLSENRRRRVSKLIQLTKNLQQSISISARLPGFKRQAFEAEQGSADTQRSQELAKAGIEDIQALDKWIILRRMFTRYNWLSTRVGDDKVPSDGIVHAAVRFRREDQPIEEGKVVGFETLVPLRQRRFRELLGKNWERHYYFDLPHRNDIKSYVKFFLYERALKDMKHGGSGDIVDEEKEKQLAAALASGI